MARRTMVLALLGMAACSRSFGADPASKTGAPAIRGLTVLPAVVAAGQSAAVTFGADRPLTGCAAQVAGQSATCQLLRAQCSCAFVAVGSLPEGPLSVVVQGQGASGAGSASTTLQLDKTPPVIIPGGVRIVRGGPGATDRLELDPQAVVDPPLGGVPYPGQAVQGVRVWAAESGGMPIATLVPTGGGGSVALGTTAAGPRHAWISAVDVPGNESTRVAVAAGDDAVGPTLDDAGIAFVRKPLGEPDQVRVDLPPQSTGCAVLGLALFDLDGGAVATASVADGGPTLIPVGTGSRSYPRLWLAARDRCGAEGQPVEVGGADVEGPLFEGLFVTLFRAPQGVPSAVGGEPGAVQDLLSAVREVRAYDGPFVDAGLRVAFQVNADGSFNPQDAGAQALDEVWLEGTDKCGNDSPTRTRARKVLATLNLAGRTPYDERQSPIALYAFASPFDPRELATGPGVGPAWAAEVGDASPLAARDGQGLTTVAAAQPGEISGWLSEQPGFGNGSFDQNQQSPMPHAIYFDLDGGRPVLISSRSETNADPVRVWDWVGDQWKQRAVQPGLAATSSDALEATWDPVLGAALVVHCPAQGSSAQQLETWVLGGDRWQRLPATLSVDGGSVPCMQKGLAVAFDANVGAPVLVSFTPGGAVPDPVATYTLRNGSWTPVSTPTEPTTARSFVAPNENLALAYDPALSRTLLFTSADDPGAGNTWLFDGANWIPAGGPLRPSPRAGAAIYFDARLGKMVLFGGGGGGGGGIAAVNDTWFFDAAGWSQANPSTSPSPRTGAVAIDDPVAHQPLLWGGELTSSAGPAPGVAFNEAWTFDGSAWTPIVAARPAPRISHALAFDLRTGQSVLFGGFDPSAGLIYGDTWLRDGDRWTAVSPGAGPTPPARYGHALAYDSRRGQVVLFGGGDASHLLNDTWVFDGRAWTEIAVPNPPSPRFEHAMVYDPVRDRVVLFGGWNGGFYFSDTWEFDGRTWTQVQTARSPTGRHAHGLAYDARRARTVLVGGSGLLGDLGDQWEFDGSWTLVSARPASANQFTQWPTVQGPALLVPPDWSALPNPSIDPNAPPLLRAPLLLFGGLAPVQQFGATGVLEPLGAPWALDDGLWALREATPFPGMAPLPFDPAPRTRSAVAFDSIRGATVLFGGAVRPPVLSGTSGGLPSGSALQPSGDTWLYADQVAHRRTASHLAAVALPDGARVDALTVRYAGSASGLPFDGGSAGVDLLLWSSRDGGSWTALGTDVDGGLFTATPSPDDDGGYGSAIAGGQLWLQALAPSSGEPADDGGVPSTLTTDFLEVQASYVLP